MSSNTWKAAVLVVAAFGSAEPHAFAQTTQTTGTSGTVGTDGSVRTTSRAAIPSSPQEQVASAETMVSRGGVLSQRVTQMLDDARREADVIRVTCLNDKLTQINANLRTAQSRLASLQKTVDLDQRNHEMTVLTVLGQKLQVLDQEANQCVGQDLYETGATKVVTDIDTSKLPIYENNPTETQLQVPTAPSLVGPVAVSSDGAPSE
ncbi:MAG: hypothetical protein RL701_6413 [Pseudomonadota bacterium]|jgi:hypothetical protein